MDGRPICAPRASDHPRGGLRWFGIACAALLSWLHSQQAFQTFAPQESPLRRTVNQLDRRTRYSAQMYPRLRGDFAKTPLLSCRRSTSAGQETPVSPAAKRSRFVQCWGAFGVAAYLSYGVKKVVPIVIAGCAEIVSWWQWAFLAGTLFFFAYVEGYRGFQKGFSPRVVSRAWAVSEVFDAPSGTKRPDARELFTKYGSAYLLTSITLSLISFSTIYAMLSAGFDVPALLTSIGFGGRCPAAKKMGTAALAYALHKAISPIRFPPTLALTTVVAGWMGKPVEVSAEQAATGPLWHKVLAPAFCIGYFHGSRKRVISSWCVTSIIFAVVVGVKRLGNPYRAIIDAGVIVGLAWGVVSILAIFAKSIKEGKPPDYDPALPSDTPYSPLRA